MENEETSQKAAHQRLSAQDASFLAFESPTCPMHVGGLAVFEGGPLATATGGLDIARVIKHIDANLDQIPVYRKLLQRTPITQWPVWVDDADFDISRHVRHVSLPQPGSDSQLRTLAGRILSQPLDPDRPLWEMWFVEGLEGGRFAMIGKIHHSLLDGAKGVHLMTQLYSPSPDAPEAPPSEWTPSPVPTPLDLLVEDLAHRASAPAEAIEAAWNAAKGLEISLDGLRERWGSISHLASQGISPVPKTPLNGEHGRQRSCDWSDIDLARLKCAGKSLGGTVNDAVLAMVCGALRRLMFERGDWSGDDVFRVAVPVNVRGDDDDMEAGNRVGAMLVDLPIGEPNPRTRFEGILRQTGQSKELQAAEGVDALMHLADVVGSNALMELGAKLTQKISPYNMIVTNVRGPDVPLYVLGSKLERFVPQLPLFDGQGLGVAAMSYAGRMNFGFIADPDLVPDLLHIGRHLEAELEALEALTDV